MTKQADIITILGHTAAGKTGLAANVAYELRGEVISADSRQVYRGMTIGTGKDYDDYNIGDNKVLYHLIDIVDAGSEYNVYEFQKDFYSVYDDLRRKKKVPVICGGTGLYIESVLRSYGMLHVPVNESLRSELEDKSLAELGDILRSYKQVHNSTDTGTRKRAVRAIEIAEYIQKNGNDEQVFPKLRSLTIGIYYDREERRARISGRLKQRMEQGMIEEVEALIRGGVSYEKLEYYGLEYKFLSRYLAGKLSYDEMFAQLNTAIHRFAKRQMTYFRGMERRGVAIHWIRGERSMKEKTEEIIGFYTGQLNSESI